jgi:hypothetical protein
MWRELGWLRLHFRVDSWSFAADLIWHFVSDQPWFLCSDVTSLISPGSSALTLRLWSTPLISSHLSLSLMLRPKVSRPFCLGIKLPSGAYYQIFITVRRLRVCWCGALSLTRGRVCHLQLLLALASAVILGSESRGTRDHILLSQIRDFPFRRLLRLAGLRWKYSAPPPHGSYCSQLKFSPPWNRMLAPRIGDTLSKGNFSSVVQVVVTGITFVNIRCSDSNYLPSPCPGIAAIRLSNVTCIWEPLRSKWPYPSQY